MLSAPLNGLAQQAANRIGRLSAPVARSRQSRPLDQAGSRSSQFSIGPEWPTGDYRCFCGQRRHSCHSGALSCCLKVDIHSRSASECGRLESKSSKCRLGDGIVGATWHSDVPDFNTTPLRPETYLNGGSLKARSLRLWSRAPSAFNSLQAVTPIARCAPIASS
jgi:hypothetical protein